jgi:acetyl/propionyl-CoA carboxylase alpha subunit
VEPGAEIPIFYDSLISKLIAWGEDRPQAIARMKRALLEYEVGGIRTTIPFFRWMLEQPEFTAGAFHTGYLDEVLQQRRGEPFITPDLSLEEVAAIAAAVNAIASEGAGRAASTQGERRGLSGAGQPPDARSGWKTQARRESLRL